MKTNKALKHDLIEREQMRRQEHIEKVRAMKEANLLEELFDEMGLYHDNVVADYQFSLRVAHETIARLQEELDGWENAAERYFKDVMEGWL